MGIWEAYEPEEDSGEDELEDDLEEDDDDLDIDQLYASCPECGSDDLEHLDSTEEGDEYLCNDCGERFVEGEEDDE